MTVAMLLAADSPAAWLATHLVDHFAEDDDEGAVVTGMRSRSELLADDAALLTALVAHVEDVEVVPAAGAAKIVAAAVAGSLSDALGFGLAAATALFVPAVDEIRWRWSQTLSYGVELGHPQVVVPLGHPWAGQPGVQEVSAADFDHASRTVVPTLLTQVLNPLVDALRRSGKVGARTLWDEIADGFGLAVGFQPRLPVAESALARLRGVLDAPATPWRRTPRLAVRHSRSGALYVMQKGGCCLAYLSPLQATPPGQPPDYCSTCRFRTPEDCDQRQLERAETPLTP